MSDERTPEQKETGILAEAIGAGVTFPVAVLVGWFAGRWADRHLSLAPWGTIIGMMLGLGAALVPIFRLSAAFDRAERERLRRGGAPTPPSADDPPGDGPGTPKEP